MRAFLDTFGRPASPRSRVRPNRRSGPRGAVGHESLLGLLNQLTFVESSVSGRTSHQLEEDVHVPPTPPPWPSRNRYRNATREAKPVLDECTDLGAPVPRPTPNNDARVSAGR